jgi:uncharacterized protein YcgI (DUF1989 family)
LRHTANILSRARYPIDAAFYEDLLAARRGFSQISSHRIPRGAGYGFRIEAGQAFRFRLVEAPQIADVCFLNANDPSEHYAAGTQLAIEGTTVTRLTRIWGTPPLSRPLATCIADSLRVQDNPEHTRDHASHGAHCNPHHWMLYAKRHPRTCYDNLRAGMAMVGLSQRSIHDNINLFQKTALDPYSGRYFLARSDAERGDYVDFYCEVPLLVVLSLCPYGDGGDIEGDWESIEIPVYPIDVEIFDTGIEPRPWPM